MKKMLMMLCAVCAVAAVEAGGRVFNAGEALRANVEGTASNPCAVSGGTWSWLDVDVAGGTETLAATAGTATRIAGSGFAILCGSALIWALVRFQGMQTTYSFVINIVVSVAVNFVVRKFFVFKG